MKTKVKIELFKPSGKWNTTYEFETEKETYEAGDIIQKAIRDYNLQNSDFTIEFDSIDGKTWNKVLVKLYKNNENELIQKIQTKNLG